MQRFRTPGVWSQGRFLDEPETRDWPDDFREEAVRLEKIRVYTGFSEADHGRSRRPVAYCIWERDAVFISAAPDLYEACPDLSYAIAGLRNGEDPMKVADELENHQRRIAAAKAKAEGRN